MLCVKKINKKLLITKNNHQISLDYQELVVCSCSISDRSDHQTGQDVDEPCLDPESQELMRHNQHMLLF